MIEAKLKKALKIFWTPGKLGRTQKTSEKVRVKSRLNLLISVAAWVLGGLCQVLGDAAVI
jgi:hypothetical protein